MGFYWGKDTRNGANFQSHYEKFPKDRKKWYTLKEQFRVAAPKDVLMWNEQISTLGIILKFPESYKNSS